MLLKVGNRIVNTDLIRIAQYEARDPKNQPNEQTLVLHFGDSTANALQNTFRGLEAQAVWEALTRIVEKP